MMKFLSKFYMFIIFALLYAPIVVLIVFSFNDGGSLSEFTGISLKWYGELFRDEAALTALKNSLLLAVCSSCIATVIATFAALGLHHLKNKYIKGTITSITNIPMMNPDIVTGVSMMLLFVAVANFLNAKQMFGFGTMLIAHTTFNLPYALLSITPRFNQLDKSLSEAAQDLGATPMQGFLRVILPDIMPGVFSGFIMALTMSIDDFVVSFFTTGSGVSNLSITIYTMAKRGISPKINALSTLIFGCVFILLIGINLKDLRKDPRSKDKVEKVRIPY